jgi:vacuolar-type H+-ATPase subunit E/Vma4
MEEVAIALTASLIVLAIREEIKKAASKAIAMPKSTLTKTAETKKRRFSSALEVAASKISCSFSPK